jgi:hypothetical protein
LNSNKLSDHKLNHNLFNPHFIVTPSIKLNSNYVRKRNKSALKSTEITLLLTAICGLKFCYFLEHSNSINRINFTFNYQLSLIRATN